MPFCSHISKCRFSYDVAHICIRIHMYVLCMMLYIILNNTIHRGRTKMEIKKGKKYKSTSILMHPVLRYFTFEIDAAGK